MTIKKPTFKTVKRVTIATASMLTASLVALGGALGYEAHQNNKNRYVTDFKYFSKEIVPEKPIKKDEYDRLQDLRKKKLPTTPKKFNGEIYQVADEQDVLELSKDFALAIEDYFKTCGASDWANPYSQEFWPEDIEYAVTAIAFMESSYRTDVINEIGCGGLTGLHKEDILKTLGQQWLTPQIWKDKVPKVNCNPDEVDIFNGATCIEYTYYNIGYNLANRLKTDKYFIDIDGTKRSIWNEIDFTEDKQLRLIIASHRYGLNNIIDSIFKRNYDKEGNLIPLSNYIYSEYVEGVMDKMVSLELEYGENLSY